MGEHVYLHILNNAKKYVYINTPYLIVDDSMLSALRLAAKSGVDIRIITPHRWDKWWVHMTTRSYYRELIKSGVKIYEYTNGFIHSKPLCPMTVLQQSGQQIWIFAAYICTMNVVLCSMRPKLLWKSRRIFCKRWRYANR